MDKNGKPKIIPAIATTTHVIEGGPIVQQAAPEDYFLASVSLQALQDQNGRDLEFILKSYLPIRVIEIEGTNRISFIESLGLVSSEINPLEFALLETLSEQIDTAETEDEIEKAITFFQEILDTLLTKREVSIAGLLSRKQNALPVDLLEWPTISEVEPFSFFLIEDTKLSDLKNAELLLNSTIQYVFYAEETIARERRELDDLVQQKIDTINESLKPQIDRLDLRIHHLEQEINKLEILLSNEKSGKDKQTLEARRKALKRDMKRRTDLIESSLRMKEKFDEQFVDLDSKITKCMKILQGLRIQTENIAITKGSVDLPSDVSILLLPMIIIGFTKRGKLEINLVTPSKLVDNKEQLGRRKDFINPFEDASDSLMEIRERVLERIDNDVSLRKKIRSHSANLNLLSLKIGRKTIREGAAGLVADGYVKPELAMELETLLDGISETELPSRVRAKVISSEENLCKVKFHIIDDLGQPVDSAAITIDSTTFQSSEAGILKTSLPLGNHMCRVQAFGFSDSSIEFTLESTQDAVVPITLTPLPTEERLELTLERLVERADRIDAVRSKLWEAFQKHGTTLVSIPAYRSSLKDLLIELGYDPENWMAQAKKRKGMVKRLLKRDDRTDGIRRDILRIAEDSKQAGGIMLATDLLNELDSVGWDVVPDEIDSILDDMKRDGLIVGITTSVSSARVVQFVPVSLTDDPPRIIELASKRDGYLTIEDAVLELGWTEERIMNSLDLLVERGIAKLQQSYASGTKYWFPGLRKGKK